MKNWAIFDHDGTLINSLPMVCAATNAALQHFTYQTRQNSDIIAGMVYPTIERFAHLIADEKNCPVTEIDQKHAKTLSQLFYQSAFEYLHLCTPYLDIIQLSQTLAAANIGCSMLSNNSGKLIRKLAQQLNYADTFTHIWGEDDVSAPKPSSAGLHELCKQLKTKTQNSIYIGDSAADAYAAQAAGLPCLLVCWGAHNADELQMLPHHTLCEDPQQLGQCIQEIFKNST